MIVILKIYNALKTLLQMTYNVKFEFNVGKFTISIEQDK